MTSRPAVLARRARRMLRWYPRSWRDRYGEEFTELLIADLAERPRSWRRGADVARSGLLSRLAGAGLSSHPLDPAVAARASLAALACSSAVFGTFGAAMWAQLAIGGQWAPLRAGPDRVALTVMSAAILPFALLAVLAAIPVAWAAGVSAARSRGRGLRLPLMLIAIGALVLVMGGRHFGNGWPGTGGHWWPYRDLVPGGVAAFAWACTLSVTSYWAHPGALASFPAPELAWMVLSPAAMGCLVTGATRLVRRLELSPRMLRYEAWVASAAGLSMAAFLSGALCWVTEGAPGPHGLFHAGAIDVAGLAVMTAALITGWRAVYLVHRRGPPGRTGESWCQRRLDGACSVPDPPLAFATPGPSVSGSFFSRARRQEVGYTIAYPPGHQVGSELPLILALHPFGASHQRVLNAMTMAQALALRVNRQQLPPMAMAAADGGRGYWNPHPGDDPMAMVTSEFIPMCQRRGLGRGQRAIGTLGISMGGYGAILLAEKFPGLIRAVAAIGPAIWTNYAQARAVNPGAYASAAAFARADVVTHARKLAGVAVRMACGVSDPFHPGAQALARALPPGAVIDISKGCHSGPFFVAQEPPSLAFLGHHLTGG